MSHDRVSIADVRRNLTPPTCGTTVALDKWLVHDPPALTSVLNQMEERVSAEVRSAGFTPGPPEWMGWVECWGGAPGYIVAVEVTGQVVQP